MEESSITHGLIRNKASTSDRLSANKEESDTTCGIGSFRPNFLQGCANVNTFVGAYSLIGMVSQTLSMYINSQVPALEKQFGLSSTESGLVMSFNDIGFFVTVLFATSVVRFVHIPRFIYFCMTLYGLSGILCSVPHFIAQAKGLLSNIYFENSQSSSNISMTMSSKLSILCDKHRVISNITECTGSEETSGNPLLPPSTAMKTTALVLIGIGMVVQGIGKAPRTAAFTIYVDDNADRRKTGFYAGSFGVMYGCAHHLYIFI